MDRYTACTHQAKLCRNQAEHDHHRKAYWHSEADRWEQAAALHEKMAVSFGVESGRLVPKPETTLEGTDAEPGHALTAPDEQTPRNV